MPGQIAPFGSWKSPISASDVFGKFIGLEGIQTDGDTLYWCEFRPDGRTVLVCLPPGESPMDVTPPAYNVRTRVHEYGGGDYLVYGGIVYLSNFDDQRLYRQVPGSEPQPFTQLDNMRYADAVMDASRNRLIVVREDHTTGTSQPVNTLVGIRTAGDSDEQVLVSGSDFYSSPCLNPQGTRLAWLSWNHPNMPWDGTELWVALIKPDGSLGERTLVAGGLNESIFQPQWSPGGTLYFISDRTGWWNLYRWEEKRASVEAIYPLEAEFGRPQWGFGLSTYGFVSEEELICTYSQNGIHRLASIDTHTFAFHNLDLPYTFFSDIHTAHGQAFFIAASASEPTTLIRFDLASAKIQTLRRSREVSIDPAYFSVAQPVEFPTNHGLTAHAYFYPPTNRDFSGPRDTLPPLLVMSHGGPTGSTLPFFRYSIQFWTTRGFAVLDVDYSGSTGYGRDYRERLKGQWGIVDVADCVNGARYLVAQGLVDGNQLAITGGSAGGYVTLCAVTFYNLFKAGASYYGISDLEVFTHDTHKFESHYSDSLIGPYPERRDLYLARSPIHHIENLACPLILFQGLDDPIVPPNQSRMIYDALRERGLPVAYLTFPGEQHGFTKAENSRSALEAELYFYSRIFKFDLADEIEPVEIDNL